MSFCVRLWTLTSLNESPSEKEGKYSTNRRFSQIGQPSMKVPPKRKGNLQRLTDAHTKFTALNESPSEKEGKYPVKTG